jgi:hypothetical protein
MRIQTRIQLFRKGGSLRILILIIVIGNCNHWFIDPPGLHFEPPGLHCERLRLYFEPVRLLNVDFNVDPDSPVYSNADPESRSSFQKQIRSPGWMTI